jgi:hypothetical protein
MTAMSNRLVLGIACWSASPASALLLNQGAFLPRLR